MTLGRGCDLGHGLINLDDVFGDRPMRVSPARLLLSPLLSLLLLAFPSSAQTSSEGGLNLEVDPTAVAAAQQLGFPPVSPNTGIIGPFTDQQGLIYLDQSGRISYFAPDQLSIFFAITDAQGESQVLYALTPTASYQLQGEDFVQVAPETIEPDIAPWPLSGAMVNVLIVALQQYQSQANSVPVATTYQQQAYINNVLHNTSMNILNNIGNEGCTEHYDGVYYLGCW